MKKRIFFIATVFFLNFSAYALMLPPDSVTDVPPVTLNFTQAAQMTTPSVVHIKTYSRYVPSSGNSLEDFFRQFYGDQMPGRTPQEPQEETEKEPQLNASGSGVIASSDGYIITNNHIAENADKIEVILNDKRSFTAVLIGNDPTTDIALLKIDAEDLSAIQYGNSDNTQIGDWVLAVGNPFNLTSTVTAGIVSAKGRNINILGGTNNNMAIESFIQTDAAVNPGNSGGALVDLQGKLIGINTAIASPTGAFAGYSFAVPVNLVKKVVGDLKTYREVQRGFLGVIIRDLNAELAREKGIESLKGVYVEEVNAKSAAEVAGLQKGDIVTSINGLPVNTPAELQETVALQRPGDKVTLKYRRHGKEKETTAVLKNKSGTTEMIAFNPNALESKIGATLKEADPKELEKLKLSGGVKVTDLRPGRFKEAGIPEGFIITHIDKKKVNSVKEARAVLQNIQHEGVLIEGLGPDGKKAFFAIGF